MGSDLSYRCLSGDSIRIRLTLYRDCSPGSSTLGTSETIRLNSASCGLNITATARILAGYPLEVTPICPSMISSSSCRGGTLPGIQQGIYEVTVYMPAHCADWVISWTSCCRNGAINTIRTPSSASIYIQATFNNTLPRCDNSPEFTTLPVPFICLNTPYVYNHGAFDLDGDSLFYSLVPCNTTSSTATVNYITPTYSATQPLATTGPVVLDPYTGNVSLTPNTLQVGVMAILVQEFRGGVLIGSTMRDIQIRVIACTNNPPQLDTVSNVQGGEQVGPYKVFVCVGDSVSFNIWGRDIDTADTLTITSNLALSIPGATYYPAPLGQDSIVGTIGWRPTDIDVGRHPFTMTIKDNACPIFGITTIAYEIVVVGVSIRTSDSLFVCYPPGDTFYLEALGSASTYHWSVIEGDTASLRCDTCQDIYVYPTSTTTYVVEGVAGSGCKNKDTVTIVLIPAFTLNTSNDTTVCLSSPVQLHATPSLPGGYLYIWSPRAGLSDSSSATPIATPTTSTTYTVHVIGGGIGGCDYWDTVRVNVIVGGLFPKNVKICNGGSYVFNGTTYTTPGSYYDTTATSLAGCDSVFVLNISYDTAVRFRNRQADTIICSGTSTSINNIITYDTIIRFDTSYICDSYTVASIPFAPILGGAPLTILTTGNDVYSTAMPIGFTFNFYCLNFTQFYVSTNGFVGFTGGAGSGCCTGQLLPNTTTPNNLISCGWNDFTLTGGATIQYFLTGTAPNRILVIKFNNVPHFSVADGANLTTQVLLYETSNKIEIHTTSLSAAAAAGNGHTFGIENVSGSRARPVPGRNQADGFTMTNESWRFTKGYNLTPKKVPLTISWSPTTALVPTNRVNPIASPTITTTYTLSVFDSLCYFYDTVTISIARKDTVNQSLPICLGSSVSVGSHTYASAGFYRDTLRNYVGCDSFVNTTVVIKRSDTLVQNISICDDSSFLFNGHTYAANGTYRDTFVNSLGCDSIIITNLTIRPRSFVTQNLRICIGNSVSVGAHIYNLTGTYLDTLTNNTGCDSIITTNVFVDTMPVGNQTRYLCPGDAYTIGSHTYSVPGTYRDTFANPGRCDTIIQTTIINYPISTRTITVSFCIGDTLRVGTSSYSTTGTRFDTLVNFIGCDSIVTSILTVYPTYLTTIPITICYDQSYFAQGADRNTPGTYYDSLISINGCDSVIKTILTVTPLVTFTRTISICFGDSLFVQGANRGNSGTYYDTLVSYRACDSLLITNLIVKSHSYTIQNPSICNGSSYNVGVHSYTAGGSYQDTLTNYLGCDSVITTNLRVDTVVLAFTKTNITCFSGNNGQINGTATGGVLPYQFNIGGAWQASGIFTNLIAGTYTLTVRDFNGCTTNTVITLTQPLRIIPTIITNTPTSCYGGNDGSIVIGFTNGFAPYQYSLNNISYQTANTFSGLVAGNYRAYVQDSLGCIDSINFTITQPASMIIDVVLTHNKCHNDATGIITISPRGGTSPYNYSIDGGTTFVGTNSFSGLLSGVYTIVVSDFKNCTATTTVTLNNPTLLTLNATGVEVQCWDSENGKIINVATGGTLPYQTYEYSQNGIVYNSNGINANMSNLPAGFYYVKVTDANGCIATDTTTIGRPPIDTFAFTIDSTTCYGAQYLDGSILVTALANPPYTWTIDGGPSQNFGIFYGLGAGNHLIIATNSNGCIDSLIQFVPFPPPVVVDVVPDTVYLTLGGSQQIQVNVQNATNPTYIWNTSQGLSCNDCPNPVVNPYNDMIYTVTVYDHSHPLNASECYGTATLYVMVEEHNKSYVPNAFTPGNGDGINDLLMVYGEGIKKMKFTIYDRWGELLFESDRQDYGWDGTFKGKLLNPGVYIYYVEAEYLDSKREIYQGSATLLK